MDVDGNGVLDISDIKFRYNARRHPDVMMGKRSEDDVLYEFLDTFEAYHSLSHPDAKDRHITENEWVAYYANISCSIDNDDYFELMVRNAFNLS
jgi:hypothetical protein